MSVITKLQAKSMVDAGKAAQVATMFQENSNKTFGVLTDYQSQKTHHYLIGEGDLRNDVPETTPTFDR